MKRKRIVSLLLVLLMLMGAFCGVARAEEVIEISSVDDFAKIRNDPDGHFVLTSDIQIPNSEYRDESGALFPDGFIPFGRNVEYGAAKEPIPFTGVLDGNGYTISNVSFFYEWNASYYPDYEYLGLFAYNKGTIKNLEVSIHYSQLYHSSGDVDRTAYVGGVAGYNEGTIENCAVEMRQSETGGFKNMTLSVGGVVGKNVGTVRNCFVEGELSTCTASLPAEMDSLADVIYFGGLAGTNEGTLESSLSVAALTYQTGKQGIVVMGDVVGKNTGTLSGAYALKMSEFAVGTGKTDGLFARLTETEMKQRSSFVGFDFESDWLMETAHPKPCAVHDHEFVWSGDEQNHKQTCISCASIQGEGAHSDANNDFYCDICGLDPRIKAPVITKQPQSASNYDGEMVRFTVKATGKNLKYQWYYGGSEEEVLDHIYSFGLDTGCRTATLTYPALNTYGEMHFYCVITNDGGSVRSDVVTLTPMVNVVHIFTDVKTKDWYYKNGSINYVYNKNLFKGTSETTFEPNAPMTRAMFVTVLGRLHGVEANHKAATPFKDVKKKQYYTGYVNWASKAGIVNGVSKTEFAPNDNVTREQICKMMAEYCKYAKISLRNVNKTVTFTDAKDISSWARNYVATCQRAGLVNGEKGEGGYSFNPKGNATRAQVATIICNFAQNYL